MLNRNKPIKWSEIFHANLRKCEKTCYVISDMSKANVNGIGEYFSYAKLTTDKIHIKKLMLEATDNICKDKQKQHKIEELLISKKRLMAAQKRQGEH